VKQCSLTQQSFLFDATTVVFPGGTITKG